MAADLTAAVIIPTFNRAGHVRTCLEHLRAQTRPPHQIAVIDASPNEETRRAVADFPEVTYLRNPKGAGSTATSRLIGCGRTESDIVVFLDDDAYAEPDWLDQLLQPYADPVVGGVGGRAVNGIQGEESEGQGQIGMFLPNGTLTGFFGADPGRVIDVDHMLGANMSLRRAALDAVGGIRDYYPGTCLREETDPALRVSAAGWRLVMNPAAVVRHVAGPYAKGKRFDLRYVYYGQRNHLVLLISTLGLRSPYLRRYLRFAGSEVRGELVRAARRAATEHRGPRSVLRTLASGAARSLVVGIGVAAGFAAGLQALGAERERERQPA